MDEKVTDCDVLDKLWPNKEGDIDATWKNCLSQYCI